MKTVESRGLPGPEATLRVTVDEIVQYHAEPVGVMPALEPVRFGSIQVELPGDHIWVSGDTVAAKSIGAVCTEVVTQELADPGHDKQQPHRISLHAHHSELGSVITRIILPAYQDPSLRPSKRQKSRPGIGAHIAGEHGSKGLFNKDLIFNDLLGTQADEQELELLELQRRILVPVHATTKRMTPLRDDQMTLIDQYLNAVFWTAAEVQPVATPRLSGFRDRLARYVHRDRS